MMIIIEYCQEGEPISDFNYQNFVDYVKQWSESNDNEVCRFKVSTSIPIFAIKAEICKGNIDHTKIQFKYCNKLFQPNEYGIIENWPKGFCEIAKELCETLLREAVKKYRIKKNRIKKMKETIIKELRNELNNIAETVNKLYNIREQKIKLYTGSHTYENENFTEALEDLVSGGFTIYMIIQRSIHGFNDKRSDNIDKWEEQPAIFETINKEMNG